MALKWTPEEDEILLAGMREKKIIRKSAGNSKIEPRELWLIGDA